MVRHLFKKHLPLLTRRGLRRESRLDGNGKGYFLGHANAHGLALMHGDGEFPLRDGARGGGAEISMAGLYHDHIRHVAGFRDRERNKSGARPTFFEEMTGIARADEFELLEGLIQIRDGERVLVPAPGGVRGNADEAVIVGGGLEAGPGFTGSEQETAKDNGGKFRGHRLAKG